MKRTKKIKVVELGEEVVQTSTMNCINKHMTIDFKKRNWLQKFLLFLAGE